MYVVYSAPYGGQYLPAEVAEKLNVSRYTVNKEVRTSPVLIKYVRANPYGELALARIPAEATDWAVWEYDGAETVFYVLGGKIHTASREEV